MHGIETRGETKIVQRRDWAHVIIIPLYVSCMHAYILVPRVKDVADPRPVVDGCIAILSKWTIGCTRLICMD